MSLSHSTGFQLPKTLVLKDKVLYVQDTLSYLQIKLSMKHDRIKIFFLNIQMRILIVSRTLFHWHKLQKKEMFEMPLTI